MIVGHIRFLRKTWESRILTKFSNVNENGFLGLKFEDVFLRLCASVFIYSCDQINSDQPGKMNIFKCSHAIPRLYQLSNGIFVPMNIENGHNRLCRLFFLIHSHIHIWAVFHWNNLNSMLKKVKYTILYIFEGGFINIYNKNTIHAFIHWVM